VLVIGNPEGLTETVSDGIIAAFRKNQAIIQITAPVSPGSSGSPVLDESGKVIGIATSSSQQGQNLNFAISVDAVRDDIAKNFAIKRLCTEGRQSSLGRFCHWFRKGQKSFL
jgi:S1-C subfamily serine protease